MTYNKRKLPVKKCKENNNLGELNKISNKNLQEVLTSSLYEF